MSDLEDRIARFEAHVLAFPDSELPHFALGKAYLEAGREEEAVKELRETIRLKPDYLVPTLILSRLLMDHGLKEEARRLCGKAKELALIQGHEGPLKDVAELEKELAS